MRGNVARCAGSLALAATLLPACTDLPTFNAPDRSIATIRMSGCSGVAVQSSCPMSAQAWDAEGNPIPNPPIVWISSKPHVASVTGAGSEATLTGVTAGRTEIKASDAARRVSDSMTVRVAPLDENKL
ncbi:MAG: hypothetical protein KY397_03205 [Gemmatimonadetes bacterium]|nr:hypothetical protein [Gemmatimonadota bacterium]